MIANRLGSQSRFVDHVKVGNLAVVPTLPADLFQDATAIRLSTPFGLFHQKGTDETYYLHLRDAAAGPRDRAGREIDLFDGTNIDALTVDFKLKKDADENLVAPVLNRMNSPDEDGTSDKSTTIDCFGQFQQRNGRLYGKDTVRFSRVADNSTLSQVRRDLCGECLNGQGQRVGACPGVSTLLYQTPLMLFNLPPPAGGISEPFVARGSRMQMTYRDDDFQLGYTEADFHEIDVEQMHWAPFVGRTPALLTYDVFDRVTIQLGTAEKRPDIALQVVTQGMNECCNYVNGTFNSGLTASFAGNYLDNSTQVEVVKDKVYAINPNRAFSTSTGSTMIPYPTFDKSYTWRDRRYMGWDPVALRPRGLGGAQNPGDPQTPDTTKDISSPHVPEINPDIDGMNCKQDDDYVGSRPSFIQDHAPSALPLIVDFFVYPDDPDNGLTKGDNLFQIGYVGPPYPAPGHGYYNRGWPWFRVHSTGGIDSQQNEIRIDPKNELNARGGWLNNQILGKFNAPPGDDHIYWAQADFVRKQSVVTYGYIDTLRPRKNEVDGPSGWTPDRNGYPDIATINDKLRPSDFAVILSPAPEDLPVGTKVFFEYRGSDGFDKSGEVYQRKDDETAKSRGNLLNPHYACEQFRYAGSNRVQATGMTNYVKDIDDLLKARNGNAPRFLNWRITFENNPTLGLTPYVDYHAVWMRYSVPK